MTDITYIETDEGWLYLAGVKDLFNGEIVGYAMDERMTRSLIMRALFRAVALRRPYKGCVVGGLIVQDRLNKVLACRMLALPSDSFCRVLPPHCGWAPPSHASYHLDGMNRWPRGY